MKVSEFQDIIEEAMFNEVKRAIIKESKENKKEVYHIKCDGEPVGTYDSQQEAESHLDIYKKDHPGKQFIIEKGIYESHSDMIEKLDQMGEELEEKEKQNMENQQPVDEKLVGKQKNIDKNDNGKIDAEDFKMLKNKDEEECDECWGKSMEEEDSDNSHDDSTDEILKMAGLGDEGVVVDGGEQEEVSEEKKCCNECGGMMNEEGMCSECGSGMYESKRKTIRLKESELVKLITKMVNESIPGLDAAKKSHTESGKENKQAMTDVDKKMKDYLSIEGNDNPEFPHQIGKGDKVARKNTPEQEDEIKKNFAGLENLDYDIEPDEKFKSRLKMAIEGDKLMGNAPTTEKTNVKPSNGAKLGEEPKDKDGNSIPTPETAKKIEKQVKDRAEDKKNRVLYSKEAVPTVKESKVSFTSVLEEEIKKMKKIVGYNEKTQ
jgi:hypothetical protein